MSLCRESFPSAVGITSTPHRFGRITSEVEPRVILQLVFFLEQLVINLLLYNAELASGSFPQSPVPHIHFDTLTYQSYKLRLLLFDVASQLLNALLPRSVSCTVEKRYCTDLTPFLSPLFLLENPILLHSSFLQKVDM